jgi:hypothetical protein
MRLAAEGAGKDYLACPGKPSRSSNARIMDEFLSIERHYSRGVLPSLIDRFIRKSPNPS